MEEIAKTEYFYKVLCKGGHVGVSFYYPMALYVIAEDGKIAAEKARYSGRVKHNQKDAILSVEKITYSEYHDGMVENSKNPYFFVSNIQEQRKYPEIYECIVPDDSWNKKEWEKSKRKKYRHR